ncbi:nucleoside hydrolase [Vibrio paucivorans]|uniref:Nucleoside hydrolase n=1 Tax=Vibrio paucivorans TaxID=2829489 RepID=A0A9X3CD17_9VIBR|nr:nucleoside hydrolase [Vibrio paucivorans]MCW8333405.1 nucleoside hydrolase [Vibrio paucivorans]
MRNIIIDTDIGDDADDILALGLALSTDQLNLVGVTTVFKNTRLRAKMAKSVLKLAGRTDVPVYAGCEHRINGLENDNEEIPCQYQGKMDSQLIETKHAVDFMADALMLQNLTIVGIGPLTNIARLIKEHPEVIHNIDELVLMGGCYYRHVNEWNIICDPEAADIVFKSGINIRAVGLDVTTKCHFDGNYLSQALDNANTELKKILLESCDAWFSKTGFKPILHDPLTIFSLLEESDIEFNQENVRIELKGQYTTGMTVCTEDEIWGRKTNNPNCLVAKDLNYSRFVEFFLNNVFLK